MHIFVHKLYIVDIALHLRQISLTYTSDLLSKYRTELLTLEWCTNCNPILNIFLKYLQTTTKLQNSHISSEKNSKILIDNSDKVKGNYKIK